MNIKPFLITIGLLILGFTEVNAQIGYPPSMAIDPSPVALKAAEEVLSVQHMDKQVNAMFNEVFNIAASKISPDKKEKFITIAKNFISKYDKWNELKQPIIQIYAETYTISELKQLAAFYKTPLGQKMAENQNTISQQIQTHVSRIITSHQQDLADAFKQ
jgi:hypothetical protein